MLSSVQSRVSTFKEMAERGQRTKSVTDDFCNGRLPHGLSGTTRCDYERTYRREEFIHLARRDRGCAFFGGRSSSILAYEMPIFANCGFACGFECIEIHNASDKLRGKKILHQKGKSVGLSLLVNATRSHGPSHPWRATHRTIRHTHCAFTQKLPRYQFLDGGVCRRASENS